MIVRCAAPPASRESAAVRAAANQTRRLKDKNSALHREFTLVGHSLGSRELVRYLTRHGDARVTRMVLVAPTTPQLRRSAGNPDGWDPAILDANYAAIAGNVPQWCTSFEALRVYPGAGHGLYASDHQTLNADILAFIRETATARPAVTPAETVV
jgi:pimeloyl-ACP methyl ester carboxylesterase